MKSVILWGAGSVGKTHTMNKVIRILCEKYGATVLCGDNYQIDDEGKDECLILSVFNKNIAIFTGGDDRTIIENNLKKLDEFNTYYDFLLGVSRTKGSSCDGIYDYFSSEKDEIFWIRIAEISDKKLDKNNLNIAHSIVQHQQALSIIEIMNFII